MNEKIIFAAFAILFFTCSAAAEDKLKPFIDDTYALMQNAAERIGDAVYALFPSLRDSLGQTMKNLDNKFPPIKGFHWVFYLALFIAILAVLCKLWEKSEKYFINAVVGVILLLLLIHVLGVELRITLLSLVISSLLGVPGVIFIVVMHYLGVVI